MAFYAAGGCTPVMAYSTGQDVPPCCPAVRSKEIRRMNVILISEIQGIAFPAVTILTERGSVTCNTETRIPSGINLMAGLIITSVYKGPVYIKPGFFACLNSGIGTVTVHAEFFHMALCAQYLPVVFRCNVFVTLYKVSLMRKLCNWL